MNENQNSPAQTPSQPPAPIPSAAPLPNPDSTPTAPLSPGSMGQPMAPAPSTPKPKRKLLIVAAIVIGLCMLAVILFIGINITVNTKDTHDYSSTMQTRSFSSAVYTDLVDATAGLFTTLNSQNDPGPARHSVTIAKVPVHLITYDTSGSYDASGRFGLFVPDGTSIMCATDYTKRVSLMFNFDPSGSDGNTTAVDVYGQTNCIPSSSSTHGTDGDIKITPHDVTLYADVPASSKAVFGGIAQQLRSKPTILSGVRAHFIGNFEN